MTTNVTHCWVLKFSLFSAVRKGNCLLKQQHTFHYVCFIIYTHVWSCTENHKIKEHNNHKLISHNIKTTCLMSCGCPSCSQGIAVFSGRTSRACVWWRIPSVGWDLEPRWIGFAPAPPSDVWSDWDLGNLGARWALCHSRHCQQEALRVCSCTGSSGACRSSIQMMMDPGFPAEHYIATKWSEFNVVTEHF